LDSKGIGIRQLRDGLTRYLARVRRGERLVITDRGTPVAALAPHRRADATTRSARVAAMLSSGHVSPAQRPFPRRPPLVRGRGTRLSDVVSDDRR
jgi:prevent-host-death family protein